MIIKLRQPSSYRTDVDMVIGFLRGGLKLNLSIKKMEKIYDVVDGHTHTRCNLSPKLTT